MPPRICTRTISRFSRAAQRTATDHHRESLREINVKEQRKRGHDTSKISKAESIIGCYTFTDKSLLWEALQMAGSDVRQAGNRDVRDGNQRLAVLGDAVSKAVLCQQWYRRKESLGDWSDAFYTRLSNANLNLVGRRFGLHECYNGPSEHMPPTNYQVATLVEAVLGAVYEDSDHNLLELRQVMERLGLGYPEMVVKGIRTVGPGQL